MTYDNTIYITIIVYVLILVIGILIYNVQQSKKDKKTIKRLESGQIFTATETGMYTFSGGAPVMLTTTDPKGKVFYDKVNDTIVDGNDLEELGDL